MSTKNILVTLDREETKIIINMRYGSTIKELIAQVKEQYDVCIINIYNAHNKTLPNCMPLRGPVSFRVEY